MKPYLNITEQLELAKSRGMSFENEGKMFAFLLRKNYYNSVSIYGKYFLKDIGEDFYKEGTLGEEIISVYHFDRELRSVLFKKIVEIETNLKSTIASIFCDSHPEPSDMLIRDSYNARSKFDKDFEYIKNKIVSIIDRNYQSNGSRPPFNNAIDHYVRHHGGVPFWVLMNWLSFGDICIFFKIMKDNERAKISMSFRDSIYDSYSLNDTFSFQPHHFENFAFAIKDLRNIVAHDNSLKSFKLRSSLIYLKYIHHPTGVKPEDSRQDLYNVFLTMKLFISKKNFARLSNTIRKRMNSLEKSLVTVDIDVILKSHGFPEKWNKLPKLEQI